SSPLPAGGELPLVAQACEPGSPVGRDAAHDLRRGDMPRLAAHLPDPAIRLAPMVDRRLDLADEDRPDTLVEPVTGLRVEVDGVEDGPPDVVLPLVVRAVADPDRSRALVPAEVVERPLCQLALAAHAVHDLEIGVAPGRVGDEVEEVVRLPVETERVQAPQGERRIADPGVAIVPVALA